MASYRFNRQDLEDGIQMLAEKYPKCFFVNPGLRRPLKKNIVADLQKDGIAMPIELISTSVDWYKSHIRYQYCLEAGAKCIAEYLQRINPVYRNRASARSRRSRRCCSLGGGIADYRSAVLLTLKAAPRHKAEIRSVWRHVRRYRDQTHNQAEQLSLPI